MQLRIGTKRIWKGRCKCGHRFDPLIHDIGKARASCSDCQALIRIAAIHAKLVTAIQDLEQDQARMRGAAA